MPIALAQACSSGEGALHRAAILAISEGIKRAVNEKRPWTVEWRCSTCGEVRSGNPARHAGATLALDQILTPSLRPDLVVRDGDGRPRFAAEVVVTHPPDPTALDNYATVGIGVAWIRPTWESIGRLRDGLRIDDCDPSGRTVVREEGIQAFCITGVGGCTNPRHPPQESPPACTTCQKPTAWLLAETASGGACWRCKRSVPVCDLVTAEPQPGGHPFEARSWHMEAHALSSERFSDLSQVLKRHGVRAKRAFSKTVGSAYLMHHCPKCNAKQGDFFMYRPGLVSTSIAASWWSLCPDGHTHFVADRPWPERAEVERQQLGVQGVWGGAADEDGPTVKVTSGLTVNQAVRRMMGGGW